MDRREPCSFRAHHDRLLWLLLLLSEYFFIHCADVTRHRVRTMGVMSDSNFDTTMNKVLHDGGFTSGNENKDVESKNHKEEQEDPEDQHTGFGYENNGQKGWWRLFPRCHGQQQSPVNLDTSVATTLPRPHLLWWNYFLKPETMELINDGHTVKLHARWARPIETPFIWSSPDGAHFIFDHLHFHWGPNDTAGSEHTLNNQRFPLEMHAVHYRSDLHSLQNAAFVPGGLRVVAVLFRISERNNSGMEPVTEVLSQLQMPGNRVHIHPFPLNTLLPVFAKQYLAYNGSLTTPPCFETVLWVIRKEPLYVSSHQMELFRTIMSSEESYNKGNYRLTQPTNGRDIVQI